MAPRETEINAYAKFWSDQQRVLWYVMAFSVLVNWSLFGLKGLCYIFKGSWPHGFNSWLELATFREFFSPNISFYFSII